MTSAAKDFTVRENTTTVQENLCRYTSVPETRTAADEAATTTQTEFLVVLTAARAGREWAARQLYRDHHPRLIRYLRAQEPRAADDIASETWIGIIRGLAAFQGEAPQFRTWIFSIARRQLAEFRRTAIKKYAEPTDHETFAHMASTESVADDVANEISGQEAIEIIKMYLSAEQAEVIMLRVLGDFTAEQAADLMGRTPEWVRVNQHRGLAKLSEIMKSKMSVTL